MRNLQEMFLIGVVGNIAIDLNHNENRQNIPQALVPIYIPSREKHNQLLEVFPFSHSKLQIPSVYDNIKIEPELVLECDIKYYNKKVHYIIPKRFTVMNNPTLHRLSVHKLSHNKNWGENSKGIAKKWLEISEFETGGSLSNYNIVSFIKRDGIIVPYTIDTKVEDYPYLFDNLISWTIKQIKTQKDILSLDNITNLIQKAGNPDKFLISVGSTLTTSIGDKMFLEDRDEVFIVLYDRTKYRKESIKAYLLAYKTRNVDYDGMIILHQQANIQN